jgi:hypothetical protein
MKVWHRSDGTIIKITEDNVEGTEAFITIEDKKLPNDIRELFALGKYSIKGKKIITKDSFLVPTTIKDNPLSDAIKAYKERPNT